MEQQFFTQPICVFITHFLKILEEMSEVSFPIEAVPYKLFTQQPGFRRSKRIRRMETNVRRGTAHIRDVTLIFEKCVKNQTARQLLHSPYIIVLLYILYCCRI